MMVAPDTYLMFAQRYQYSQTSAYRNSRSACPSPLSVLLVIFPAGRAYLLRTQYETPNKFGGIIPSTGRWDRRLYQAFCLGCSEKGILSAQLRLHQKADVFDCLEPTNFCL